MIQCFPWQEGISPPTTADALKREGESGGKDTKKRANTQTILFYFFYNTSLSRHFTTKKTPLYLT